MQLILGIALVLFSIGQAVTGISRAVIPAVQPSSINSWPHPAIHRPTTSNSPNSLGSIKGLQWLVRAAEKLPGVTDIKEFDIETELKNENIATAVILFGTLVAISLVASQGVAWLSEPLASAILRLIS